MNNKRVILVSSSTGGHALPVFELYKELKHKKLDPIVIHSGSHIENIIFKDAKAYRLTAGKLHRRFSFLNLVEGLKFIVGIVQSFFLLLFLRPKIVFSKGGFCAMPVLTIAELFRIPIFIHESDSVIGLTNKLFLKNAKKVFLSFPLEQFDEKLTKNAVYSGLIFRLSFLAPKNRPKVTAISKPVIFITGGSQGASYINKIVFEILPMLLSKFTVIHQVGSADFAAAQEIKNKMQGNDLDYQIFDFSIEKGENAFLEADLIICRAGATTIGELSALSKASILIPYRYAAAGHQQRNARFLEKSNAAILLREDNLSGETLFSRVQYLLSDKKNIETLGKNCHNVIKHDGLVFVTEAIANYLKD